MIEIISLDHGIQYVFFCVWILMIHEYPSRPISIVERPRVLNTAQMRPPSRKDNVLYLSFCTNVSQMFLTSSWWAGSLFLPSRWGSSDWISCGCHDASMRYPRRPETWTFVDDVPRQRRHHLRNKT